MFYNNHMRTVHSIKLKRKSPSRLCKSHTDFLDGYFCGVCDRPSLDEIEEISKSIDVKKEAVYWWFHNKRKKFNQNPLYKDVKVQTEVSLEQDVDGERSHDRISPRSDQGVEGKNKRNRIETE